MDCVNYLSDLVFGSHRAVTQSGGLSPGAMAYHEHIATAIRRRLPRMARRVMLRHLDTVIPRADELYGARLRPVSLAGGRAVPAGPLSSRLSLRGRRPRSEKGTRVTRPAHLTRER
jgi:hypothetical protein